MCVCQIRFPYEAGYLHPWQCLHATKWNSCCRPKRTGERKHPSLCNSIVDANMSVFNLVIVKKIKKRRGEKYIPSLTDLLCLGSKRASRIHKFFNLSKKDDVYQYVVKKPLNKEGKKLRIKAPKSHCCITPFIL